MPTLQDERSALIEQLSCALPIADKNSRRYRRIHLSIAVTTVVASLLAAFLTGDSAMGGKTAARALTGKQPSDLAPAWRYICGIAAVCSLVAGISSGVGSIVNAEEHRTKATACSGKLASLKSRMETDLNANRTAIDETRKAIEMIQSEYREYLT